MFLRSKMTPEQQLKIRIRDLKGKTVRQKFAGLLQETLTDLYKIQELGRVQDNALEDKIKKIRDDYQDQTASTSSDKVLGNLVRCSDDVKNLLDDMMHQQVPSTYRERLGNILDFISDFSNKQYSEFVKFYEGKSNKILDQLHAITKDVQYKVSRMNHQIELQSKEIFALEEQNIKRAKELQDLDRNSYKFSEIANQMSDAHNQMELIKGTINLSRKSMTSFNMLAKLFEDLALHDEYYNALKENGYIKKMIKRLYRHPDELDVLDNSAEVTEVLTKIKDEIIEVETTVNPIKKMVFEDTSASFDADIVAMYQNMSKSE